MPFNDFFENRLYLSRYTSTFMYLRLYVYRRVRFTNQNAYSVSGIFSQIKGLRPNTCQHFRQRSGNFHYHRRFHNQVHSRSLNTRCPTTAKVRAALIDLILL